MTNDYLIPSEQCNENIEVKRSQFIAFAAHTNGIEQSKKFIKELKDQYPDARHHCYGYISGHPSNSNLYGYSDDNEPSGTAGMPIFTHLKHSLIGEITIVVVRYFGGTKLGTGGLSRAYGDAAKQVLKKLKTVIKIETKNIVISCKFDSEAEIRKCLDKAGGKVTSVDYNDHVILKCCVPCSAILNLPYSASVEDMSSM